MPKGVEADELDERVSASYCPGCFVYYYIIE